jgi:monoamine oxidase
VIAAGGGIGGLCCAYELMDRGHDVTVLEASGRTSGHVETADEVLGDRGILMGSGNPDVTAGEALCAFKVC